MSSFFGGSSTNIVPVPPPASLFPGTTTALAGAGPGAVAAGTSSLENAASGVDVHAMYQSIVAASEQQRKEGSAAITSSMGASGMASSSDAMRAQADFQTDFSSKLLQTLQSTLFQGEQFKLAGAEGLMNAYTNVGTSFAPTAAVVQQQNANIFGSLVGAGTNAAMLAALWP